MVVIVSNDNHPYGCGPEGGSMGPSRVAVLTDLTVLTEGPERVGVLTELTGI